MKTIKNVCGIIAILALVIVSSCGDSEEGTIRLTSVTVNGGGVITVVYEGDNVVNLLGQGTTFRYDDQDRVINIASAGFSNWNEDYFYDGDLVSYYIQTSFDEDGNEVSKDSIVYEYNSLNQPIVRTFYDFYTKELTDKFFSEFENGNLVRIFTEIDGEMKLFRDTEYSDVEIPEILENFHRAFWDGPVFQNNRLPSRDRIFFNGEIVDTTNEYTVDDTGLIRAYTSTQITNGGEPEISQFTLNYEQR